MKNLVQIGALFFVGLGLISCSSTEIGNSKDVAQERIYQQYEVRYNAENPELTAYAQFRFAGSKGTTLVLNEPSSIRFDGNLIKVDSADFSGAYYQFYQPITKAWGSHQFEFADYNKKVFTNSFTMEPFELDSFPNEIDANQPLNIPFRAGIFGAEDEIDVSTIASDSSFSFSFKPIANKPIITIAAEQLKRQQGKPFKLLISLRKVLPLKETTAEGGTLLIRYTLKPLSIRFKK
ncbi:MAG: hypothetical protein ACOYKE_08375 [Ferruginibacter sp.]